MGKPNQRTLGSWESKGAALFSVSVSSSSASGSCRAENNLSSSLTMGPNPNLSWSFLWLLLSTAWIFQLSLFQAVGKLGSATAASSWSDQLLLSLIPGTNIQPLGLVFLVLFRALSSPLFPDTASTTPEQIHKIFRNFVADSAILFSPGCNIPSKTEQHNWVKYYSCEVWK